MHTSLLRATTIWASGPGNSGAGVAALPRETRQVARPSLPLLFTPCHRCSMTDGWKTRKPCPWEPKPTRTEAEPCEQNSHKRFWTRPTTPCTRCNPSLWHICSSKRRGHRQDASSYLVRLIVHHKELGLRWGGEEGSTEKAAWSSLRAGEDQIRSNGRENCEQRSLEIYSGLNWRSVFCPVSTFSLFDEGRRPENWELSGISRWCAGKSQTLQWQRANNCKL